MRLLHNVGDVLGLQHLLFDCIQDPFVHAIHVNKVTVRADGGPSTVSVGAAVIMDPPPRRTRAGGAPERNDICSAALAAGESCQEILALLIRSDAPPSVAVSVREIGFLLGLLAIAYGSP